MEVKTDNVEKQGVCVLRTGYNSTIETNFECEQHAGGCCHAGNCCVNPNPFDP